jgi:hypothetical protein
MAAVLRRAGPSINRKHVRRLMRLMGIEAIYQRPTTSKPHPEHVEAMPTGATTAGRMGCNCSG